MYDGFGIHLTDPVSSGVGHDPFWTQPPFSRKEGIIILDEGHSKPNTRHGHQHAEESTAGQGECGVRTQTHNVAKEGDAAGKGQTPSTEQPREALNAVVVHHPTAWVAGSQGNRCTVVGLHCSRERHLGGKKSLLDELERKHRLRRSVYDIRVQSVKSVPIPPAKTARLDECVDSSGVMRRANIGDRNAPR
jgi:hypothetical protein